ncbi:MAG: nuclear transport factor 2 family protein [Candidatus Sulfotelmatobacter sp.]
MKYTVWMLLICPLAFAGPCPAGHAKDNGALIHLEQTWAQALEQRDSATLDCILADEFEDAGPDGMLTNRATTLAKASEHSAMHHDLTDLHAHVQGDFGYIRGLATAKNAEGKVVVRVRFTDVYVYREGRWQCVAGHESMLTESGR